MGHPNLIKPNPFPSLKWKTRAFVPFVKQPPKSFRIIEPLHERAIVYPWLSTAAVWHELKYSLRSVYTHFTDRECPIYIIGDKAPSWLANNPRVSFIAVPQYAESNEAGLWEAWQQGAQIAREIIWMNDDIYFLKPTGWDDLRVALTEEILNDKENNLRSANSSWRRSLGDSCADLRLSGVQDVWNFATHTPYLFEIEKAREIFRLFHLPFSGAFETIYHNWHHTPHKPVDSHRTMKLPTIGLPRYLNHSSRGPGQSTMMELERLHPNPAPWELVKELRQRIKSSSDIPRIVHMASFPPRLEGLLQVVNDLLPQCDVMRLYLNGYNEVPEQMPKNEKLEIVLAGPDSLHDDLGSHGKFWWLGNEDCYHLTVDDDIFYPFDYVDKMVDACSAYHGKAFVGMHGLLHERLINGAMRHGAYPGSIRKMLSYTKGIDFDRPVHILGSGVMCCRPSIIRLTRENMGTHLHSGDDEDLAIWAQKNNVPMIRIKGEDNWVRPNPAQWIIDPLHRRPEFKTASREKLRSWKSWKLHPIHK